MSNKVTLCFVFLLATANFLAGSGGAERAKRGPKVTFYQTDEQELTRRLLMQQPQQLSPPQPEMMMQPQPPMMSPMSAQMQRAASFMVDPLVIIALISLPLIGTLGLSSLIMPLIPIGIYLIQQFLPSATGRRRRRRSSSVPSNPLAWQRDELFDQIYQMLDKFNTHQL